VECSTKLKELVSGIGIEKQEMADPNKYIYPIEKFRIEKKKCK